MNICDCLRFWRTPLVSALSISSAFAMGCSSAPQEAPVESSVQSEEALPTASNTLPAVLKGCDACEPDGTKTCWYPTGPVIQQCTYTPTAPPAPSVPGCAHNVVASQPSATDKIVANPKVIHVLWGSWWSSGTGASDKTHFDTVWGDLANARSFWNRLSEYGVGMGSYSGSFVTHTDLANGSGASCTMTSQCKSGETCTGNRCINEIPEATLTSELRSEIDAGSLPASDSNSIYVIHLPPNVASQEDIDNRWVGHHDDASGVFYAVVEGNQAAVNADMIATHEINEAATDANPFNGFRDPSIGEGEVADLCNDIQTSIMGHVTNKVWSQQACRCVSKRDDEALDFDGDWKSDLAVYHQTQWAEVLSSTNTVGLQTFGAAGDLLVPGDYDGDGKADIATWRPVDVLWRSLLSSTNATRTDGWGLNPDTKVPRDYDGHGITDLAIWTASTGVWAVHGSWKNQMWSQALGQQGDIPVPADYDGDGKADFAVWRPSDGTWRVLSTATGETTVTSWGVSGDKPVPGDYDGDGKTDFATWRPSDVFWRVLHSSDNSSAVQGWGLNTDVLVPRDFDGDGKTDFAIYTPSPSNSVPTFYYISSRTGGSVTAPFGATSETVVQSTL